MIVEHRVCKRATLLPPYRNSLSLSIASRESAAASVAYPTTQLGQAFRTFTGADDGDGTLMLSCEKWRSRKKKEQKKNTPAVLDSGPDICCSRPGRVDCSAYRSTTAGLGSKNEKKRKKPTKINPNTHTHRQTERETHALVLRTEPDKTGKFASARVCFGLRQLAPSTTPSQPSTRPDRESGGDRPPDTTGPRGGLMIDAYRIVYVCVDGVLLPGLPCFHQTR